MYEGFLYLVWLMSYPCALKMCILSQPTVLKWLISVDKLFIQLQQRHLPLKSFSWLSFPLPQCKMSIYIKPKVVNLCICIARQGLANTLHVFCTGELTIKSSSSVRCWYMTLVYTYADSVSFYKKPLCVPLQQPVISLSDVQGHAFLSCFVHFRWMLPFIFLELSVS